MLIGFTVPERIWVHRMISGKYLACNTQESNRYVILSKEEWHVFEDAVLQPGMFEIVLYLLCQFAPFTSVSTLNDSCCSERFSDDYWKSYAPNRRAKEVVILIICPRIEGSACVRLDVIDPQNCLSVYAVKAKLCPFMVDVRTLVQHIRCLKLFVVCTAIFDEGLE